MTRCDTCGVTVSTTGYLGGGIVCKTCATAKRKGDESTIAERIKKYGGGEDWEQASDIQELLY